MIIAGLALSAAALGLAATTDVDAGYGFAAVWITLLGAGIGLAMPAAVGTAIGALSPERAGSGSGLMQALRQVGATIGVAVLGTVLSSDYHASLAGYDVPSSAERAVHSKRRCRHRDRSSARQLLPAARGPVGVRPRDGHRDAGLRRPVDRGCGDRRTVSASPHH